MPNPTLSPEQPKLDALAAEPRGLASFDALLSAADDAVKDPNVKPSDPTPAPEPKEEPKPEPKEEPKVKKEEPKPDPEVSDVEVPDFEDLKDLEAGPESVKDDDVPEDVQEHGEKAVARWKELKAAEKENQTLKVELEGLKKKAESADAAVLRKQLEEAQRQINDQEKYLKATSVQNSTEYRTKVSEPLAAYEQAITGFFPEEEKERGDAIIESLMRDMPESSRDRIVEEQLDGYSELSRNRMYNYVRAVENVFSIRNALLADSERTAEVFAQEQMAETARQKDERLQAYRSLSDDIFSRLKEKLPGLTDADGNTLPEISGIHDELKGIDFRDMKDSTLVYSAYANRLLPKVTSHMATRIKTQGQEIADLKKTIQDLKGTDPSGSGGGSDDAPSKPGKPKGFIESLEEQIASGSVVFG